MITLGRFSTKDSHPTTGDASTSPKSRPHHAFVALPVVGTAVLPKLVCPFCWPAYTGLLSFLGLGFINYTPYLLPLTLAFLLVAIVSLGYGAKIHRGYAPLLLGVLAAGMIITGKFLFASDWTLYGGLALLLGASLWNAWPPRRRACPV
jgi:mercuric ion transport protein